MLGPRDAPVKIIEFADFQCPYCARAELELEELQEQYPREIAIIFRNFPLPGHALAMPAARAGQCAGRAGRFGEWKHLLFASQDLLGKVSWPALAKAAGVADSAAFQRCLTDPGISQEIADDVSAGTRLGVEATPTFIINGVELAGYSGPPELRAVVERALRARTAPPHP